MGRNGDVNRGARLGAHMSIAGGTPLAIERALRVDCNVLQIFVKNANRWRGKVIDDAEVASFREAWQASGLGTIVAHASYLINLAAADRALRAQSIEALKDELQRCDRLGLHYLVLHPGAHVGQGEVRAVALIARALDEVYDSLDLRSVRVALEHTAGQGSSIGYRFEHLRDILAASRHASRLFVCLDTCHLFASGYDIREEEGYGETMSAFAALVGLDRLQVFHFNDSLKDLGSRVDRHTHIGAGKIGTLAFSLILNDTRFQEIPKILETPKGDAEEMELDARNLALLRSLIKRPSVRPPV